MKLSDLDLDKVYTYADYFSWKFEERVELIKGKIFKMSPAPNRMHQDILRRIGTKLDNFLGDNHCGLYYAPFDVRFPRKSKYDKNIITVLQPDICVVCDKDKLDKRGCIGAPDIVVEILSPGNNAKELKNKYEIYEQSGVKEYWIVSPQDQTFIVCTLTNGAYTASKPMTTGEVITSTVLPEFSLSLSELFKE